MQHSASTDEDIRQNGERERMRWERRTKHSDHTNAVPVPVAGDMHSDSEQGSVETDRLLMGQGISVQGLRLLSLSRRSFPSLHLSP